MCNGSHQWNRTVRTWNGMGINSSFLPLASLMTKNCTRYEDGGEPFLSISSHLHQVLSARYFHHRVNLTSSCCSRRWSEQEEEKDWYEGHDHSHQIVAAVKMAQHLNLCLLWTLCLSNKMESGDNEKLPPSGFIKSSAWFVCPLINLRLL